MPKSRAVDRTTTRREVVERRIDELVECPNKTLSDVNELWHLQAELKAMKLAPEDFDKLPF